MAIETYRPKHPRTKPLQTKQQRIQHSTGMALMIAAGVVVAFYLIY